MGVAGCVCSGHVGMFPSFPRLDAVLYRTAGAAATHISTYTALLRRRVLSRAGWAVAFTTVTAMVISAGRTCAFHGHPLDTPGRSLLRSPNTCCIHTSILVNLANPQQCSTATTAHLAFSAVTGTGWRRRNHLWFLQMKLDRSNWQGSL